MLLYNERKNRQQGRGMIFSDRGPSAGAEMRWTRLICTINEFNKQPWNSDNVATDSRIRRAGKINFRPIN